jgi:NAD(P)-dependent dehydrogenase (short-subunit alcohol dehydrogenase family)
LVRSVSKINSMPSVLEQRRADANTRKARQPKALNQHAPRPRIADPHFAAVMLAMSRSREPSVIADTPLGRLVTEEEVARMAVAFCSPQFGVVTGQTMMMDGGRSIPRISTIGPELEAIF